MKSYIKAISYYLPQFELNNFIIEKSFPEWSIDKIAKKTGISSRYIAATDETSGDMAIKAAEKLFEEHNIDKLSIDYLILCTQSPDYFLPTTACVIQEKLGLKTSIGAFDMNLGCSGYMYGLGLAKGLIFSGQANNILFITSETYSKFIHPQDKSNKTIFGDAAAATLISSEDGFAEIGNFEYGTDGKGANNLIVKNGAMRNLKNNNEAIQDEFGNYLSDDYLFMNGSEIFSFTLASVPKLIDNTIQKNNLLKENINLFVLHQANMFMLESLRKKCKIENEKFYIHIDNCGNTVSSTIPIALYHAQNEKLLKKSSNILLAGFGVGYSWGGTIIKVI
ncbi:ketoacyl-ACP synthase III [Flavobacterium sp. HJJ]|uniref:ketoacyl-ACP synthase III n=1 Tax=Flavobacterium sp. HJJ TaxID=2783792 RepID=UPI00188D85F9|nr:ketoacyl-ACP synthase III [Flavobacterium sp. HJJ]MBF4470292.1 ketoacyl-ACP synthase III [Flavobacterium sp. HJJ]